MARRSKSDDPHEALGTTVRGAPLEPIRTVRRELTRPDGKKLVVDVPVYPPFRLEERPTPARPGRRARKALERRGEPKKASGSS